MIRVKVPATTANLGPGFDVLGLALELFDEYVFEETSSGFTYCLLGADIEKYKIYSDINNLVYRAFCSLYTTIGRKTPGIKITCKSKIPICRGLGSSAAAVVAGLVGANEMAGKPLTIDQILWLANQLEGHPDNVTPALLGGLVVSAVTGKKILYHKYSLEDENLACLLIVPEFTVETRYAREVLPDKVLLKDATFNLGRLSLFISSLTTGNYSFLQSVMEDRLHEPYRKQLIPGYDLIKEAGIANGAYGVAISGAGPTILALADRSNSKSVGAAMVKVFNQMEIEAHLLEVKIHNKWVEITTVENQNS